MASPPKLSEIVLPSSSEGDPRRSELKVPFRRVVQDEADRPVDGYYLAALFFAMLSMLTKVRIYPWMALLMAFASLANANWSNFDSKGNSGVIA